MIIVPGAPQYRVGSHRQFVTLAREMAARGLAVLRFDYRGMGDSNGEYRSFEEVSDDLDAAVSELISRVPGVLDVVLWGFCDGASASCFYAATDTRVRGLVLINPWVRDRDTVDQALVRHYYLDQLKSRAFWRRLTGAEVEVGRALAGLSQSLFRLTRRKLLSLLGRATERTGAPGTDPLSERVSRALAAYRGRVLLFLSGADLTAQEFEESVLKSRPIMSWLGHVDCRIIKLEGANHTYSRASWRRQVHDAAMAWILDENWLAEQRPAITPGQ